MCIDLGLSVQTFNGVEKTAWKDLKRYREKPSMDKHKMISINKSVTLIIIIIILIIAHGGLLLKSPSPPEKAILMDPFLSIVLIKIKEEKESLSAEAGKQEVRGRGTERLGPERQICISQLQFLA